MAVEDAIQGVVNEDIAAVAVVARDGTVLASEMPEDVSKETFSIMCATIHGAGVAAATELRRGHSRRIVLESRDGPIVIFEAGRRALVVFVLQPAVEANRIDATAQTVTERVARETA